MLLLWCIFSLGFGQDSVIAVSVAQGFEVCLHLCYLYKSEYFACCNVLFLFFLPAVFWERFLHRALVAVELNFCWGTGNFEQLQCAEAVRRMMLIHLTEGFCQWESCALNREANGQAACLCCPGPVQGKPWCVCWSGRGMIGGNQGWWCSRKQKTGHFTVPWEVFLFLLPFLFLPASLLCMFTHLVVNSGPDVEALGRALLCNFWLHYEETVIVLMKEMERTTEERDDIVYDENQQCGILPIQISKSIFPLWLFSLL